MPPLPQRLRLFGIVLAMVASLTDADEVVVYDGFLGGEGFLAMSPAEQRAFAMGVIDGVLVSPLFDAPTPNSTTGLCVASAA